MMPKQTAKSGLAAKYGNKLGSALSNHATDPTEYSKFGELPGGIRNGIAQLVDCRFDQYKSGDNEGEYFFLAAGTVVSPELGPDGSPIKGLRTQIMEPVCDTKKRDGSVVTQDQHVATILNELRKLGADTTDLGPEDLETVAATLKEQAPYFRFSTSQAEPTEQYPNPRVWHNWNGAKGLEDYQPGEGEGVQDDSEAEEAPAPKAQSKPATKGKPAPEADGGDDSGDDGSEGASDVPFGDNLDDLVAEASGKDKKAAVAATNRLQELAIEAGCSEEEVKEAENWEAVAQMIRDKRGDDSDSDDEESEETDYAALAERANKNDKAATKELVAAAKAAGIDPDAYGTWEEVAEALSGADGDEEQEAEEEKMPAKKEVWMWKGPTDKKPREYEIVSVNAKGKTCTIKDTDTQKVVNDQKTKQPKNVPWSELSET